MQAHEIEVIIPEDHRLTVEVPAVIQSGPARLIFLVPTMAPVEALTTESAAAPELPALTAAVPPALARAQAYVRDLVPENVDLVDELLAERRREAQEESE